MRLGSDVKAQIELYRESLLCPNEDFELRGNYDAQSSSLVKIGFVKCSPIYNMTECKSDYEIEKWLENKYIVMIYSEKIFTANKFEELTFDTHRSISYFPVSRTPSSVEYNVEIKVHKVELNDAYLRPWYDESGTGYSFHRKASRVVNYGQDIYAAIGLYISKEEIVYKREVYSVLGYLSKVGGVITVMLASSKSLLMVLHYRGAYQDMTQRIFALNGDSGRGAVAMRTSYSRYNSSEID